MYHPGALFVVKTNKFKTIPAAKVINMNTYENTVRRDALSS